MWLESVLDENFCLSMIAMATWLFLCVVVSGFADAKRASMDFSPKLASAMYVRHCYTHLLHLKSIIRRCVC